MDERKAFPVWLLFTLLSAASSQDTVCGGDGKIKDWKANDDYCYKVVDSVVTWHDAKTACADFGSYLVSVSSEYELNYLLELLKDKDLASATHIWTGLNVLAPNGSFAWDDGTPFTFENWSLDIPEDVKEKKCVKMAISDGMWTLENCNSQVFGYVCKSRKPSYPTQPPPVTESLPGHCPKGWANYGNKCFKLFGKEDPVSWEEAKARCRKENEKTGHLASVHNDMETMLLSTLVNAAGTNAWIGLRKSGYNYIWEDYTKIDYVAWNLGMHTPLTRSICVEIMNLVLRPGKWNPISCTDKRPFVCQMGKDPSLTTLEPPNRGKCDEGFVEYKDDCYVAVTNPAARKSWAAAENACSALGESAHLVSVLEPFQQAFLALTFPSSEPLWIGYSNQLDQKPSKFAWIDKWPTTFTNFPAGQPDPKTTSERCTSMSYGGRWSLADCDQPKGYICRVTDKSPPVLPKHSGSCPPGDWLDIGTSVCYRITTMREVFHVAQTRCKSLDKTGRLASIHSKLELDLLTPHLTDLSTPLWIGLLKNKISGRFEWSDQTPLDFLNWQVGEPSSERSADCVEMYAQSLTWNDVSCTGSRGYICAAGKIFSARPSCDGLHPSEGLSWKDYCERNKRVCVPPLDDEQVRCGQCIPGHQPGKDEQERCFEALSCPDLFAPTGGLHLGECRGALNGQACYFACYPGYNLTGKTTLRCRSGVWDGNAPTCTALNLCKELKKPDGETWMSFCEKQPNRVCTKNNTEEPKCVCKEGCQEDPSGNCVCRSRRIQIQECRSVLIENRRRRQALIQP